MYHLKIQVAADKETALITNHASSYQFMESEHVRAATRKIASSPASTRARSRSSSLASSSSEGSSSASLARPSYSSVVSSSGGGGRRSLRSSKSEEKVKETEATVGGEEEEEVEGGNALEKQEGGGEAVMEEMKFLVGNPTVEVTEGILHLFKDNDVTPARRHILPEKRSLVVAVLAVPLTLAISDFCQFVSPFLKFISNVRIIRTPKEGRSKYMVVLQFRQQVMADEFYIEYNGKQFNSMEPEVCYTAFVASISFGNADTPFFPAEGQTELPTCPVCLERMDTGVTGLLTIQCNHSFHCLCLSKWRGEVSCPVCRYAQEESVATDSVCYVCGKNDSLWICLICGHIGCGRYKGGHANGHFQQSGHTYALELETQRVWDYTGDNYVHRLIQNKTDGKLVEVSGPDEDAQEVKEQILESKRTAVALEYTYLLTSQLETQRTFFEEQMANLSKEKDAQVHALSEALAKANEEREKLAQDVKALEKQKAANRKQVSQLEKRLSQLQKESDFLRQCNENMRQNQSQWQAKAESAEELLRTTSEQTQRRVTELEEQVRDLMFFIEGNRQVEASGGELKDGSILVPGQPPTNGGGNRGRGKRGRGRR